MRFDELETTFTPTAIVLFGSASRGEDIEESDIDLFVRSSVASPEEPILEKTERMLKRGVQLHIRKSIQEYPTELQNNIASGIVLHGFLEVVK